MRSTVALLLLAAPAAAAGATVGVTLTPSRTGAVSEPTITATGAFATNSGIPNFLSFQFQNGFESSPNVKKVLCSRSQAAAGGCPAASRVGSGVARATASSALIGTVQDVISMTLYLGPAEEVGDISSLAIVGKDSVLQQPFTANGRVAKRQGGGIELLIDRLPNFALPGVTITLDSLSLTAFAKRTVTSRQGRRRRRTTLGLLTNPRRCTAGHWNGSYAISFASAAPLTGPLQIPCTVR